MPSGVVVVPAQARETHPLLAAVAVVVDRHWQQGGRYAAGQVVGLQLTITVSSIMDMITRFHCLVYSIIHSD